MSDQRRLVRDRMQAPKGLGRAAAQGPDEAETASRAGPALLPPQVLQRADGATGARTLLGLHSRAGNGAVRQLLALQRDAPATPTAPPPIGVGAAALESFKLKLKKWPINKSLGPITLFEIAIPDEFSVTVTPKATKDDPAQVRAGRLVTWDPQKGPAVGVQREIELKAFEALGYVVQPPANLKAADSITTQEVKWSVEMGPDLGPVGIRVRFQVGVEWAKLKDAARHAELVKILQTMNPAKLIVPVTLNKPFGLELDKWDYNFKIRTQKVGLEFTFTPHWEYIARAIAKRAAQQAATSAAATGAGAAATQAAAIPLESAAAAAAPVAVPIAAAAAMGVGLYQAARLAKAGPEGAQAGAEAREKAKRYAASFCHVATGGSSKGDEGSVEAERQINAMIATIETQFPGIPFTRADACAAVKDKHGGYAAMYKANLGKMKDKLYADAVRHFEASGQVGWYEDVGEFFGQDWGTRAKFKDLLKVVLYAED